jgi:uncharacterized protein (DUF3084 family)
MEKRTFEEKLAILKRNLQKRLDNLPEFSKNMREQLNVFENQRTQLVNKIKQYEKDEYVVKILKSNLDYIDSQYEREIAEQRLELERLEKSKPMLAYIIKEIDEVVKYPTTYKVLEVFIDLFFAFPITITFPLRGFDNDVTGFFFVALVG